MPGVLSTSVQRLFSFVPLVVGSLFTKAKLALDHSLFPAPYLYSSPFLFLVPVFCSLVSLLISKDVDFVEVPRIPRGFLKRRHCCGCSQYTMFSPGRDRFFHTTSWYLIPGDPSFARDPWSTVSKPVSLSHATSFAPAGRKITK